MIDPKIITFITLARVQNYTQTAKILNLTQPAISQHIKLLESHFNCILFSRTTKKIVLTREGKKLYSYAQKLVHCNNELKTAMQNSHFIDQTICVATTHTMAEDIVPDILEKYHKLYPNVFMRVVIGNIDSIYKMLNAKEAVIALIDGPIDKTKYTTFKLRDDTLYVISSKDNNLSSSKFVTIQDIINQPFISREIGSSTRAVFENSLVNMGYSINDFNKVLEVNSVRFIKKLVSRNIGISIMSYERIRHEIEHDMLNYYLLEGMQSKRECNIAFLKDSTKMSVINDFIDVAKTIDYITPKKLPTKPW